MEINNVLGGAPARWSVGSVSQSVEPRAEELASPGLDPAWKSKSAVIRRLNSTVCDEAEKRRKTTSFNEGQMDSVGEPGLMPALDHMALSGFASCQTIRAALTERSAMLGPQMNGKPRAESRQMGERNDD